MKPGSTGTDGSRLIPYSRQNNPTHTRRRPAKTTNQFVYMTTTLFFRTTRIRAKRDLKQYATGNYCRHSPGPTDQSSALGMPVYLYEEANLY